MSDSSTTGGGRVPQGAKRAADAREVPPPADAIALADEFFAELLNQLLAGVSGKAGVVWLVQAGQLALKARFNFPEIIQENPQTLSDHVGLIQQVVLSGKSLALQPHQRLTADGNVGNSTDFMLLFGFLKRGEEMLGLVEIFLPGDHPPADVRSAVRLLQQFCALGSRHVTDDDHQLLASRQSLWNRLDDFTRKVHFGLDSTTIAYTLVNEARRFLECDRVTVASWNGSVKIKAVSGQDTFDPRANTVRLLANLAQVVAKVGEPLWYDGQNTDLPPQVETAAQEYVDESHASLVAVLPLRRPAATESTIEPQKKPSSSEPVIGVLIVESFTAAGLITGLRDRVDVITPHSQLALANALDHESLFLMPVWRAIGKSRLLVATRRLPWTLGIAGLVLAVTLALYFIRVDFTVESKGTLEPVTKQDIFAPSDGIVRNVAVQHGDTVVKDAPLVTLESTDLNVKIHELEGRWKAILSELQALNKARSAIGIKEEERNHLAAEVAERHAIRRSLESQLELLRKQKGYLNINSPIAGQVVTWQARDHLVSRPIQRGQVLLTLADLKADWELELHVPENHIGFVAEAQAALGSDRPVTFILASNPGQKFTGVIKSVHTTADLHGEDGNTILVRVGINKSDLPKDAFRPGVTVSAKILCGESSLGYAWFHDLIGWFHRVGFKWF